jgi:hypothetical protein
MVYRAILEQAKLVHLVSPGDYTAFGPGVGLFGRRDFTGLLYVPALDNLGIPFQRDTLQALVLTTAEIEAVQKFGPVRELIQLVGQSRFFPWPPWADRDRSGTIGIIGSFLEHVQRARFRDSYVTVVPELEEVGGRVVFGDTLRVTLSLSTGDRQTLADHKEALGNAFALLPGVRKDVLGYLSVARGVPEAFQEGEQPVAAYDVAYLLLVMTPPEAINLKEDGVGIALGKANEKKFWSAVETGTKATLTVGTTGELVIETRR